MLLASHPPSCPYACSCLKNLPSCPDCVNVHTLGHINDELDVGVVVVVGATGDLDVLVRHADVVCVGRQVLGGGHDGELDGALIAQCLVCPLPHGADLFDGGDTVIRNQNLPACQNGQSISK
jgi:hypothetical protein